MAEILSKMKGCENKENYINSIIDAFVHVSRNLNHKMDDACIEVTNSLEYVLVSIVDAYNDNNLIMAEDILSSHLEEGFLQWEQQIRRIMISNVIVCGLGYSHLDFCKLLDNKNEFKVMGILNFPEKDVKEECIGGYPIYPLDRINEVTFDYIVTLDESGKNKQSLTSYVNPAKIYSYGELLKEYKQKYLELYHKDYGFSFLYSNLDKAMYDESVEAIVTGMSYTLLGVNTEFLSLKSVKLCYHSQDLYYDIQFATRAIEKNNNIKACIMGLAYFSFDHDVSRSKVLLPSIDEICYPILNDSHHYKTQERAFKSGINRGTRLVGRAFS